MSHVWYYLKEGITGEQQHGPILEAEFLELVSSGNIKPKTKVQSPTRTKNNLAYAEQIPGFAKLFNERQSQIQADKEAKRQQQLANRKQMAEAKESERREAIDEASKISEGQSAGAIIKIKEQLQNILTSGESIELIVLQSKPVAIKADACVCTNRRLILYRPKMLGRFDFDDFLWRELQNAHIKKKLIGTTFFATHISGALVSMEFLPLNGATRLYRIAQEREEQAIEVRRNREMEERAAGATNIQVGNPQQVPHPPNSAEPDKQSGDPMERLKKLKEMLELELIDQDDFDMRKQEMLREI